MRFEESAAYLLAKATVAHKNALEKHVNSVGLHSGHRGLRTCGVDGLPSPNPRGAWPARDVPPVEGNSHLRAGGEEGDSQPSTTHRKPMWVVEVSSDCGDRAAGR